MEKNLEKSLDSWRLKGVVLSLGVGLFVMALKFQAYRLTHSTAILSDALESIVNVMAALFAVFALRFAIAPPDRQHPYGHGKIEFMTAIFEGGLIAFAALMILYEAVHSLQNGPGNLTLVSTGLWLSLLSGTLNGVLGCVLIYLGKKTHSITLEADGKHVFSDFLTSIGLLAGLLITKATGWYWLDGVIALLLGLVLLGTGIPLIRTAFNGLLDAEDRELLKNLLASLEKTRSNPIIRLHHIRAMRNGRRIHVDGHVVIPEFWPLQQAHDYVERYEKKVIDDAFPEGEIEFHLDPCRRVWCRECEMEECPIRAHPFEKRPPLTLDEMVSPMDRTDQYL